MIYKCRLPRRIEAQWRDILLRDPCVYCGGRATGLDHIHPSSRGGSDGWENRAPACGDCDGAKANYSLLSFLAGSKAVARGPRMTKPIEVRRLEREEAKQRSAEHFYRGNVRVPESWQSGIALPAC